MRRLIIILLFLSVFLVAIHCQGTRKNLQVGSATMTSDGSVVLRLRVEKEGTIGDAEFVYPPSHPEYQNILKHIGPVKPGETKPVPPWE